MEITRRTDYAVRILVELAGAPEGAVVSARRLGELQEVPSAFARAIVQQLAAAGFLTSRRGAGGGVTLARPAKEITLLELVEAMEGSVSLNVCTSDPDYCARPGSCAMHEVWREAQARVAEYLASWDFETLAARQRQGMTAARSGEG